MEEGRVRQVGMGVVGEGLAALAALAGTRGLDQAPPSKSSS